MATQDLHDVIFEWPHPEATNVIVTGTFDKWSCSVPLTKTSTGFTGSTKIPWGEKIKFKYVVDGEWLLHEDQVTETDPGGFVNHIYTAPPAPQDNESRSTALSAVPTAESVEDASVTEAPTESGDHTTIETVEPAVEAAAEAPEDEAVEVKQVSDSEPKVAANASSSGLPQLLSDIADTIAARDGTSSAFDYVASGLGVAMHNMVGMDPINNQPISIPTPVADVTFAVPGGQESAPNSAVPPTESTPATIVDEIPESLPSPMTAIVPMLIVPVNAAENNTVASSPSPEAETATPFIPELAAAPSVVPVAEIEDSSTPEPVAPSSDEVPAPDTEVSIPAAEADVAITEQNGSAIESADVVEEKTSETTDPQPTASAIIEPVTASAPTPELAPTTVADSAEPVVVEPDTLTTSLPTEVKDDVLSTPVAEPIVANQEPIVEVEVEEVKTPPPTTTEGSAAEATVITPDVVRESEGDAPLEEPKAEAPAVIGLVVEDVAVPNDEPVVAVEQTPVEQVVEVVAQEPVPTVTEPAFVPEPTKEQDPVVQPHIADAVSSKEDEVVSASIVVPAKEEEAVSSPIVEDVPVKGEEVTISAPVVEEVPLKEEVIVPVAESPVKEEEVVAEPVAKEPVKEEAVVSAPIVDEIPNKEEQAVESDPVSEQSPTKEEEPLTHPVPVSEPPAVIAEEIVVESKADEPATTAEAAVTEGSKDIPAEVTAISGEAPIATEVPVDAIVSEPSEPTPVSSKEISEPTSDTKTGVTTTETATNEPTTSSANGLEVEAKSDKPVSSNGHSESVSATEAPAFTSKDEKAFPSSGSPESSPDNTPSSSKVNTMRKKRTSIFGKLKNIFHTDKDKDRK